MTQMTFGAAIQAAKEGMNIARSGWNGKNMMVWIKKGSIPNRVPFDEATVETVGGVPKDLFEFSGPETTVRLPCFCMKTADGATLEGWLASQTDMLAEDWTAFE